MLQNHRKEGCVSQVGNDRVFTSQPKLFSCMWWRHTQTIKALQILILKYSPGEHRRKMSLCTACMQTRCCLEPMWACTVSFLFLGPAAMYSFVAKTISRNFLVPPSGKVPPTELWYELLFCYEWLAESETCRADPANLHAKSSPSIDKFRCWIPHMQNETRGKSQKRARKQCRFEIAIRRLINHMWRLSRNAVMTISRTGTSWHRRRFHAGQILQRSVKKLVWPLA